MSPLDAVALGLGTFYAAYAVARTSGPLSAFKRLRGLRAIGPLASCFYCVAFWAAIGAYVLLLVYPPALYVLAGAGAAAFLYRYTGADLT
jgi:hypothetical protein